MLLVVASRLGNPTVMWRAVSTQREPDDEFVVWRVEAEHDDGRECTVLVKISASTVANAPWTTGKGVLRQVRDAMETQGASLIASRQDSYVLPNSIVYRPDAGGFVDE
jgi:hypothetical protein